MSTAYHSPGLYNPFPTMTSPWQPGIWRRLPWGGISAIVGAILAIGAAVSILLMSDGALISDWRYPPTVYISIAYTISNVLLTAALSEGVTVR